MKKEQISDSLNMLDDAIIEETDRIRNRKKNQGKKLGNMGGNRSLPGFARICRNPDITTAVTGHTP